MSRIFVEQIVISILSLLMICQFLDVFLVKRLDRGWQLALVWVIYLLINSFVGELITDPVWNLLFGFGSVVFIAFISYRGSFPKKIICSACFMTLWTCCEILVGYIFLSAGFQYDEVMQTGSTVSKIIALCLIRAIKYVRVDRKLGDVSIYHWCHLIFIPTGSLWIIHSLYSLYERTGSRGGSPFLGFSMALLLLLNLDFFQMYD